MWTILKSILELVSPELRKAIGDFLVDLKAKAEATSNPWDDAIVFLLQKLMGF